MRHRFLSGLIMLSALFLLPGAGPSFADSPWAMHVIDGSLTGADGVKVKDVNGDGYPDIVSGFEEGNEVRAYLHPTYAQVSSPWPAVTVGQVNGPEDAVFVDLDRNGIQDVVSCTQSKLGGPTNAVFVHWAPAIPNRYLDPASWTTEMIPASQGRSWMFCQPMADSGTIRLVCGSKTRNAAIGYFTVIGRSPADWTWHPLRRASWVMSLEITDMDGDGDKDVLYSDRKGAEAAVGWLENPGRQDELWIDHILDYSLGEPDRMGLYMFLTESDLDGDGLLDVLIAVRNRRIHWLRRLNDSGYSWERIVIPTPVEAGSVKAVAAGDMDGNGTVDLVFSCEQADDRPGLMWLSRDGPGQGWSAHDIGGLPGRKFDLVQLVDLDGDGDLDVLTSEERTIDAVLWYENP
jgi:hypothetical protein